MIDLAPLNAVAQGCMLEGNGHSTHMQSSRLLKAHTCETCKRKPQIRDHSVHRVQCKCNLGGKDNT